MLLKTLDLCHDVPTAEGTLRILDHIDLEINHGDSVAIVGASGSGKSTLLSLIAGLDRASAGSIQLDGQEMSEMSEAQRSALRQRYVSFVFQNFQLLHGLNAVENVSLPLDVRGEKGTRAKALHYLERVGLAHRATHQPSQLSGGEQQRVALARAFASEAPIIFADEPTGNLDAHTGEHVADLLFDLNREQTTTLVLVTHSDALAQRCQRVLTMNAGRLQAQEPRS